MATFVAVPTTRTKSTTSSSDRTPHVVPWYSLWVRLSTKDVRPLQQVRILAMGQDGRDRLTDAAASCDAVVAGARLMSRFTAPVVPSPAWTPGGTRRTSS